MSLDKYIAVAMECGALRKEIENRESVAVDALPFDYTAAYAQSCMRAAGVSERAKPLTNEMLAQLGMRIDENGRYWITPPQPCGHKPSERNVGRDALTCDGCRDAVR